MAAPAGYQAFTFWGQYTESVYQIGSTATFSITLGNVSVGDNTVGISSYFGGYTPSQQFVNNQYGNYTTFSTIGKSAIAAVPEPETYAMLLAGLGLVGFAARRRRQG
ncbi:PEPxxWA-CTERM sorting domain-containing protein [Duganella sp. FT135W]|uniref:PEPxxWA-CTERM sorting domain-containing protein n=2 Tax=Duganella flavida TaxID=2692175 RepID=A0A6L8KGE4_9BURK|nr:PEPxxWA-CTERM sorting domain-containing protein [Duganella flavida]